MKYPHVLLSQIILYIKYRLKAGHSNGKGVHPPFAYRFISEVIFGEEIPGLEGIEELRKSLSGNKNLLEISDHGAGSKLVTGEKRSIQNLVKHTAVNSKKGQLLARIARYMDVPFILELGTGTGFSSLYMGLSSPGSQVLSCEGSLEIASLARQNIDQLRVKNVIVYTGKFSDWLPGILNQTGDDLLCFVDGDHRGGRLIHYYEMIAATARHKVVMVLDDIHWSEDMNQAWKWIVNHEKSTLCLELFNTGIVFLGYKVQKGCFIVRF